MKWKSARRILPVVGGLTIVAVGLWLLSGGCSVDREISKPVEKRDLTLDEIRTKLASSDFKQKLDAEKQIDKLEAEEKCRILLGLSREPDAAVRLIAVKHLAKLERPDARARIGEIAKDDPDPTVREFAASK